MMMPMVEMERVGLTQAPRLILIESTLQLLNQDLLRPVTLVTGLHSIIKLILRLQVDLSQILNKPVKVSPSPLLLVKVKLSDVSKLDSLNFIKDLKPY
jgi:hypothetical protein